MDEDDEQDEASPMGERARMLKVGRFRDTKDATKDPRHPGVQPHT